MIELLIGFAVIAATLVASHLSAAVDLLRFPLAWVGVLVALDAIARLRRGRSPLATPADWIACCLASVLFWDIFELVDLRLKNWWYTGVSPNPLAGALFGAVSFATVLPAVRLGLSALHEPTDIRVRRTAHPGVLLAAGLCMLALALAFPRYAFPFAWLFLWPLCEAAAAVLEPRALPTPLEARVFARVAVLGLPLGLLWESLNWQCERGWVYTVPFFEHPKLFEMPLPGYLGYLPFLLESAAALALLERLRPSLRGAKGALAAAAVLLVHFGADHLSRGQTVVSTAPYDPGEAPEGALRLERKAHMGLPRAEIVVRHGWDALHDDPALVRLWIDKAR
ncbi:MAG: hypothetical protein ACXWLM_02315 [Myxococcales bacterium]